MGGGGGRTRVGRKGRLSDRDDSAAAAAATYAKRGRFVFVKQRGRVLSTDAARPRVIAVSQTYRVRRMRRRMEMAESNESPVAGLTTQNAVAESE